MVTNRMRTWIGFHNCIISICFLNHSSWLVAYGRKQSTYLISCENKDPIQVFYQLFKSWSLWRHSLPAISHHHIAVRNAHFPGLIKITHPSDKPFHTQPIFFIINKAVSTPKLYMWTNVVAQTIQCCHFPQRFISISVSLLAQHLNFLFVDPSLHSSVAFQLY